MENYEFQNYPTSDASNPNSSPTQSSSRKHPIYRGIRMRGGKWVTEIREPGTTTRIWLGTYPTPEMAATAYDVAAIALKGSKAVVNFPECVHFYSLPASRSANDIRAAASASAAAIANPDGSSYSLEFPPFEPNESTQSGTHQEFIDEEALFDMPNLLMDMAGGLLVSPPRLINPSPPSHYCAHSPDHNSEAAGNLWGYSYPYYYE